MKLASIEKIKSIKAHPNADLLDVATCLNYQVIVKKNQFKEGDFVVFIQPDVVLPDAPWAAFYRAKSNRVKAIRLRNVWSMGIVEPISILNGLVTMKSVSDLVPDIQEPLVYEGDEVSSILGIKKYEAPEPQDLQAKGVLPFGLPVTDEERYNNLLEIPYGQLVDVTLKRDGKSWTAYAIKKDGIWHTGICGRRLEYKLECSNEYTKYKYVLESLLAFAIINNTSLVIRGEITGKGIQAHKINPHSQGEPTVHLFNTYLPNEGRYAGKYEIFAYKNLAAVVSLPYVETIEESAVLTPELIQKYEKDLETINGVPFEGVVIKLKDGSSFKVINYAYDSKK